MDTKVIAQPSSLNLGVLLPRQEMVETARRIIEDNQLNVVYLKHIDTIDTISEARAAVEAGADLLIARGYQARLIERYTNIPVVEMRLHAQEIALVIQSAKTILQKERPRIALIAFSNQISNISYIGNLLGVTLDVRYIESSEEIPETIREMSLLSPDLFIGGDTTCTLASQAGYPALFYSSTEESIREAFHEALQTAAAMEKDKLSSAQFEAILDTSANGIIRVNTSCNVIVVNKMVEELLERPSAEIIGSPLQEVLPQIDLNAVRQVLDGAREDLTTSITIRNRAWMVLMTSIRYSDTVTGAILSLHGVNTASLQTSATRKELLHSGFMATSSFSDITTRNKDMMDMLVNARSYALSDSPVLIYGNNGDESYAIAESIHNSSARRGGPFVTVNLLGIDQEDQELVLFGRRERTENADRSRGALSRADHGTLFLIGIRKLKPSVQMLLSKTMLHGNILRTDTQSLRALDARIICLSSCDLLEQVNAGSFLPTLYYQLQGLTLKIPTLNERPEDLSYLFDEEFTKAVRTYKRPLKLTEGGRKKILSLQWNGNRIQLHSFVERLVLCAKKRSIDEIYIQKTYDDLYPNIQKVEGENRLVVYETPEALELKNILQKNGGNRAQTAEELGISTTTLWRKMKKYGIEASFES